MATARQIEANRRNAQKCTGPKTEEGKARSSQNALKTGLYSESEVIASESSEAYNALIAEYDDHFEPATPQEQSLVDALIRYEWLSRRYMAADAAVWNFSLANSEVPHIGLTYLRHSQTLDRAGRAYNSARRGYTATLKELETLQAKRIATHPVQPEHIATQPERLSEPRQGSGNEYPQPERSKSFDHKLVSFRQPEIQPIPEAEPLPQTGDTAAETTRPEARSAA